MPVKRTLRLEEKENQTPTKRHAPETAFSPVTGTRFMSPAHSPKDRFKAREKTYNPSKIQRPQTDAEKLHALRSKIEGSVKALKKAKQQLEKIVSTEGSSELKTFFSRDSADLQTELCRNKELVAKVESCLTLNDARQHCFQGFVKPSSSYEFLKSILK